MFSNKQKTGIALLALAAVLIAGCKAGGKAAGANPSSAGNTVSAPASSPSPSPAPTPTPTAPPLGTIVDGWISGIPDYVPRFAYGTIDKTRSDIVEGGFSTVFKLCYTGVKSQDVDAYAASLKSGGYAVAVAEIGDMYTLTASLDFKWGMVTLVVTMEEADGVTTVAVEAPV